MLFGLYIQVSVVSACNFCYVVFPNHQIKLLMEKSGRDVVRPVYTRVGSFSLHFLLCCVFGSSDRAFDLYFKRCGFM